MPFAAAYYDGQTAKRHDVTVAIAQRGLRIRHADGQESAWPWAELRLAAEGFAGDPLRFERVVPDGASPALVFQDPAVLQAIRRANPEAAKAFAPPAGVGAYLGRSLVAAAGAAAFTGVLFVWGVPALGAGAAAVVPVSWERELGREVVAQLVPADERCTDKTRVAALQAIVDRLAAARPGSPYKYHVTLSNDAAVNAFAAPGGYIVVNAGLLARTKRPEALAGVLAHEIQHVEQRHATKGICRELTMDAILKAVTGGNALGAAAGAAKTLGALSYSRDAEAEADREGMRLMIAAHVDPQGMVEAFQMLEEEGGDVSGPLSYLSTHPRTADRVALLQKLAKRPRLVTPLAPGAPWKTITAGCGG